MLTIFISLPLFFNVEAVGLNVYHGPSSQLIIARPERIQDRLKAGTVQHLDVRYKRDLELFRDMVK